jgi:hypothetical protein
MSGGLIEGNKFEVVMRGERDGQVLRICEPFLDQDLIERPAGASLLLENLVELAWSEGKPLGPAFDGQEDAVGIESEGEIGRQDLAAKIGEAAFVREAEIEDRVDEVFSRLGGGA